MTTDPTARHASPGPARPTARALTLLASALLLVSLTYYAGSVVAAAGGATVTGVHRWAPIIGAVLAGVIFYRTPARQRRPA